MTTNDYRLPASGEGLADQRVSAWLMQDRHGWDEELVRRAVEPACLDRGNPC